MLNSSTENHKVDVLLSLLLGNIIHLEIVKPNERIAQQNEDEQLNVMYTDL